MPLRKKSILKKIPKRNVPKAALRKVTFALDDEDNVVAVIKQLPSKPVVQRALKASLSTGESDEDNEKDIEREKN